MIIGCCICYNEVDNIEACLTALRKNVDYIVAVDGAYQRYPHEKCFSTDGTIDVINKLADYVIEVREPWKDEIEKRSSYLLGAADDYYFVVDADEICVGKLDDTELTELTHHVQIRRSDHPAMFVHRIYRHTKGLHYTGAHCFLINDEGVKYAHQPESRIMSVWLDHERHLLRSEARNVDKGNYIRDLANQERFFRNQEGI